MDPADPPPKKYDLKERSFKRENVPGAAAPTAKELAIMSGQRVPAGPKPAAGPKPGDPNDVHALLQQNRTVEQRHGLDTVEIKKIVSRRKRDYWLVLIGGNLVTLGMVAMGRFNPISLIYGLAGVVIFSLSLTWIMWFIMEDY